MSSPGALSAIVDYSDPYVQPLLLAALHSSITSSSLTLLPPPLPPPSSPPSPSSSSSPSLPSTPLLQWRQYESLDFAHVLAHPHSSLANSYIIRKALIRKHYLAATVAHWSAKQPTHPIHKHRKGFSLAAHVPPTIDFELDYAEFLDDALVEAYELKASWERNAARDLEGEGEGKGEREWWILKPGMSERGQGIRLFSSEEELVGIFEGWDPDDEEEEGEEGEGTGVVTSHLRHFVVQPYIANPLLVGREGRKFHVRTYVLAAGALKVWVCRPMLALFAAREYVSPGVMGEDGDGVNAAEGLAAHLTNTCLQNGEREGSVEAFWGLPGELEGWKGGGDWKEEVFGQICAVTGEVFEAAARSMSVHFQPLPNAFEVFGLDYLVDASGTAWLLEINAFPDFAQTGEDLQGLVRDLFADVVELAVKPFFGLESESKGETRERMVEVLDIDLGRR